MVGQEFVDSSIESVSFPVGSQVMSLDLVDYTL